MKKQFIAIILVMALALMGCNKTEEKATTAENSESKSVVKSEQTDIKEDKPTIVTTFYPIYEFTKNIVGDMADVTLLIPAGTEVHDFEPSTKDVVRIGEADAFIYESDHMEFWVKDTIESLKKEDSRVIEAARNLVLLPGKDEHEHEDEEEHEEEHEEGHSHDLDPHLWLSPYRANFLVKNIRDGLMAIFPEKSGLIAENSERYLKEIEELDREYTEKLKDAKQRYFVTQHRAFSYLAVDYNLVQVGITGISASTEPTIARLSELSEYVKKYGIKYIYFEENAKKDVAETLAKETGAELLVLNPLESMTDEELNSGQNYVSIMRENLESLLKTTSVEGGEILPEDGEEDKKTVYRGYFRDEDVKDRELSDYAGNWQSVYPLLLDGSLDQVFDYKAKLTKKMTKEEYKAYYEKGYKTDVDKINITDNTIEFVKVSGSKKFVYEYVGKKILQYKGGNRGVRYLFETKEDAGEFKYVQFSDHNIAPVKTEHFHIFFGGESQEKLLEEMENWPTYYKENLTALEVAEEMLSH